MKRSVYVTERLVLTLRNSILSKQIFGFLNVFDKYFEKKTFLTFKVSKGAKIRNRYNQVPHMTQDTTGKVTNSQ